MTSKYFWLQVSLQEPPAIRRPVIVMCIPLFSLVQAVHFDWPAGQSRTMKDQFFMVLYAKYWKRATSRS